MLPDSQHPTVALAVPALLFSPKANGTEICATLFIETGEGRTFTFALILTQKYSSYLWMF